MNMSPTLNSCDVSRTMGTGSIMDYLSHMLKIYDMGTEQCLFLPSLLSLAECFKCSPVEIHQTLCDLKDQGYDFFIMGFESPITLWYPTRLDWAAAG
jgi:hypothetical protein